MKFSTFASTVAGSALFLASKTLADVDYMHWPSPFAQYKSGDCIQFYVDDLDGDDDDDERIYANLYREGGGFVRTIRSWRRFDDDDDEFAFSWCIDNTIPPGRYFVGVFGDDDDDDVSRSFTFTIQSTNTGTPGIPRPMPGTPGIPRPGTPGIPRPGTPGIPRPGTPGIPRPGTPSLPTRPLPGRPGFPTSGRPSYPPLGSRYPSMFGGSRYRFGDDDDGFDWAE